MRAFQHFVFLASFLAVTLALANEPRRPQTASELITPSFEYAKRVRGAEVAWKDRHAIVRDFPTLADLTDAELDQWLLKNFAFVGSLQVKLNEIRNSTIPVDSETKPAFRPSEWLRSAVMEAHDPKNPEKNIGLIDVKGFGHGALSKDWVASQVDKYYDTRNQNELDDLRDLGHSDGLMSFGEAIAEVSRQQAAQMLFELHNTKLETVESYAIIKFPFDILKSNNQKIPAALYLRQAHVGTHTSGLRVSEKIYVDHHGNRQKTQNNSAVDFGGVLLTDPLVKAHLGSDSENNFDPQLSRAWKYGHEAAAAFSRKDSPEKFVVYRHLDEVLAEVRAAYLTKFPEGTAKQAALAIETKFEDAEKESNIINQAALDIKSGDRTKTASAIFELMALKDEKSRDLLVSVLGDNTMRFELRNTVEKILEHRGDDWRLSNLKKLLDMNDWLAAKLALHHLADHNDFPLSWLEPYLNGDVDELRNGAIKALRNLRDPKILPYIKKALASQHDYDVLRAIDALAGHAEPELFDMTVQLLHHKNQFVQDRAVPLLRNFPDLTAALEWNKKILGTQYFLERRIDAAKNLAYFNSEQVYIQFDLALNDPQPKIRDAAIKALAKRTDPRALELKKQILLSSSGGRNEFIIYQSLKSCLSFLK